MNSKDSSMCKNNISLHLAKAKKNSNKNTSSMIGKVIAASLLNLSFCFSQATADIYFSAKVAGPVTNIFAIDDKGRLNKITDSINWRDLDHDVSSDGTIAFSSNRKKEVTVSFNRRTANYNIHLIDSSSGKMTQLMESDAHESKPFFSPDEKQLAFIRAIPNKQSIVLMTLKNKQEEVVFTAKKIYSYSWSPDGETLAIAYEKNDLNGLVILDLASKKKENIISFPLVDKKNDISSTPLLVKTQNTKRALIDSVHWSPSQKHIAYIVHPLLQGKSRGVYIYDIENKTSQLISDKKTQVQAPINWSKKGDRLLYSALVDYKFYFDELTHKKVYQGGMHLFISDIAGNKKQISTGDHLHKNPVFSPDEKRIAFLYADKINGRTLALKTMDANTGQVLNELYSMVSPTATLQWR